MLGSLFARNQKEKDVSTADKSKKVPAEHIGGPVNQDSVLHRILEIIARQTAETLDDNSSADNRTAQQRGPQGRY